MVLLSPVLKFEHTGLCGHSSCVAKIDATRYRLITPKQVTCTAGFAVLVIHVFLRELIQKYMPGRDLELPSPNLPMH